MKKSQLGRVFLLASIVVMTLFSANKAHAQTIAKDTTTENNFKVVFKIIIDDTPSTIEDFNFKMVNKSSGYEYKLVMASQFTVFLNRGQCYIFEIGHSKYNTQTIQIDTKAPSEEWTLKCNIVLNRNQPDNYMGILQYDKETNKFKHYY